MEESVNTTHWIFSERHPDVASGLVSGFKVLFSVFSASDRGWRSRAPVQPAGLTPCCQKISPCWLAGDVQLHEVLTSLPLTTHVYAFIFLLFLLH